MLKTYSTRLTRFRQQISVVTTEICKASPQRPIEELSDLARHHTYDFLKLKHLLHERNHEVIFRSS
jgi:hypothetical protein